MASEDLFGESGSETKLTQESSEEEVEPPLVAIPAEQKVEENGVESKENEITTEVNGVATEENNVENELDGETEGVNGDTHVEDEEEEHKANINASPREEIKLTVVQYQKAGDDFAFEVLVEHGGTKKTVFRNYKDLVWLHKMAQKLELGGNILPPLPPPPPKSLEPRMVLLSQDTKAVYGDHHRLPCLKVEVFLQALADHNYFSENDTVHTYLVADQIPAEEKLGGTSLWSSFTKVISDMQISSKQEPEEEFTTYLKNIEDLSPKLLEASKAFSQLVHAQQGLAMSQTLLIEMMMEHVTWSKDRNEPYSRLTELAAKAIAEEKDHLVAVSYDGRHTLGFVFELYYSYCAQTKEMLYRRLSKLQTLLSCNTQLDKAKPEKKAAAETAKNNADKAFKLISETAKSEMEVYTDKYMTRMKANLIGYAEARVAHSKRTYENLSKILSELSAVDT